MRITDDIRARKTLKDVRARKASNETTFEPTQRGPVFFEVPTYGNGSIQQIEGQYIECLIPVLGISTLTENNYNYGPCSIILAQNQDPAFKYSTLKTYTWEKKRFSLNLKNEKYLYVPHPEHSDWPLEISIMSNAVQARDKIFKAAVKYLLNQARQEKNAHRETNLQVLLYEYRDTKTPLKGTAYELGIIKQIAPKEDEGYVSTDYYVAGNPYVLENEYHIKKVYEKQQAVAKIIASKFHPDNVEENYGQYK